MLQIVVQPGEFFDEKNQRFITINGQILRLEHSLVSISKWEAKWKKPFLSKEEKTVDEFIDYIKCMTISQNVNPLTYYCLSEQNLKDITSYIEDDMTATTISSSDNRRSFSKEVITSELIYYWMTVANIPFECEKWHLNRLLTLIQVCSIKNNPGGKMSKKETLARNKALNDARRKSLGSKG